MENINDLEEKVSKFQGDKDSKEFKSLEIVLTQKLRTLYRARRDYVSQQLEEDIKRIQDYLRILDTKSQSQAKKTSIIKQGEAKKCTYCLL